MIDKFPENEERYKVTLEEIEASVATDPNNRKKESARGEEPEGFHTTGGPVPGEAYP